MTVHRIEYIRKKDGALITQIDGREEVSKMNAQKAKREAKGGIVLRSTIRLNDCRTIETYVSNKKLSWA